MVKKPAPRRLISVLAELEFSDQELRICEYCDKLLPSINGEFIHHEDTCGLPCLSGGVIVGEPFHSDSCDVCSLADNWEGSEFEDTIDEKEEEED